MSDRTFEVALINSTINSLNKIKDNLCDGDFIDTVPPNVIAPNETVTWTSGSNGVLTGTKGYVKYKIESTVEVVHIFWVNPYFLDPAELKTLVTSGDLPFPDNCDFTENFDHTFAAVPTAFMSYQTGATGGPEGGGAGEWLFDLSVPFAFAFKLATPTVEHCLFTVTVGPTPHSMKTNAYMRGIPLTPGEGIRAIVPAIHSVRNWMRLP